LERTAKSPTPYRSTIAEAIAMKAGEARNGVGIWSSSAGRTAVRAPLAARVANITPQFGHEAEPSGGCAGTRNWARHDGQVREMATRHLDR
jgi:hypothetical protein